jgi:peptidoglycan/xylan/chitin deacetylase (PgdA/CDA1 family)
MSNCVFLKKNIFRIILLFLLPLLLLIACWLVFRSIKIQITNGNEVISGYQKADLIVNPATSTLKNKKDDAVGNYIQLPVLMYHHVSDLTAKERKNNPTADSLTVSPTVFEKQLSILKSNNFTSITSDDLFNYIKNQQPLPVNPVMITFDDGYKDNYINALPLLKKYNFRADFSVITGVIGAPAYMNWSDLVDLKNSGMTISSHTVNHCYLAQSKKDSASGNYIFLPSPINNQSTELCPEFAKAITLNTGQIKNELTASKKILEDKLDIIVHSIFYPYGHYNDQVMVIAKQAGYDFGWTTRLPSDLKIDLSDALQLPRWRVSGQQVASETSFKKILGIK